MIEHLTEHGLMDAGLLYQSPFTDLNGLSRMQRQRISTSSRRALSISISTARDLGSLASAGSNIFK